MKYGAKNGKKKIKKICLIEKPKTKKNLLGICKSFFNVDPFIFKKVGGLSQGSIERNLKT